MNQLYVYIYSLPLEPPSHPYPYLIPLGHHRALSWVPLLHSRFRWLSISNGSLYMSMLLSVCPTLSFPHCVHNGIVV